MDGTCKPDAVCGQEATTTTTEAPQTTTTEDPHNEEVCKAWKEANNIEYDLKSNKGLIKSRGVNTYEIRAKRNKINERENYTGFVTWGKKNCGRDFIDSLADGSTIVVLMVKFVEYRIVGKYSGGEGSHYNTLFQFDNTLGCGDDHPCWGSQTADQFEIMVHMTRDVNFGKKDPEECIKTMRWGHFGANKAPAWSEEDISPCMSWLQKFW